MMLIRNMNTTITPTTTRAVKFRRKTKKRSMSERLIGLRSKSSSSSSSASTSETASSGEQEIKEITTTTHVVKSLETLKQIARDYETSTADISALNGLGFRRTLIVGERLIIRSDSSLSSPANTDLAAGEVVPSSAVEEEKASSTPATTTTTTTIVTIERPQEQEREEQEEQEQEQEDREVLMNKKTNRMITIVDDMKLKLEALKPPVLGAAKTIGKNIESLRERALRGTTTSTYNNHFVSVDVLKKNIMTPTLTTISFQQSFGIGIGTAAFVSAALIAMSSSRQQQEKTTMKETTKVEQNDDEKEKEEEEEEEEEEEKEQQQQLLKEEVVEVEEIIEKEKEEFAKKIITTATMANVLPVTTPAAAAAEPSLEKFKDWMDPPSTTEKFESSIEEFKQKLQDAQEALIILQDQLEKSKRNNK